MKGFLEYIRTQGVVGLAVGFILGGAISKVVASLVSDIINPILGIFLGAAGNLSEMYISVGSAKNNVGRFCCSSNRLFGCRPSGLLWSEKVGFG